MSKVSRRVFLGLAAGATLGAAATGYAFFGLELPDVTRRSIPLARLPRAFKGFTVCHLSDMHLSLFGPDQRELTALIRDAGPDIVVMTGDMVNREEANEDAFLSLCDRLPSIAPTYFITGNHDVTAPHKGLDGRIAQRGVRFMDGLNEVIERDGETISLAGVGEWTTCSACGVERAVQGIRPDAFMLMLAHRPAKVDLYAGAGADLVLAGHTHGGQVKLPFLGSVMGPDQGLFPRYSDGLYQVGKTAMYVSRGMGESVLPMRLNCPREIAFLTLEPEA